MSMERSTDPAEDPAATLGRLHGRRLALREAWTDDATSRWVDDDALRLAEDEVVLAHPDRVPDWVVSPGETFGPVGPARPGPLSALDALRTSLQTGDILVSRADKLSSAGIAGLPKPVNRFSHTALVHRDREGGVRLISSFMEFGVIAEPAEAFLARNRTSRIVVLRHEDPAHAEAAGNAAYDRIVGGPHIPYDDRFDRQDLSRLWCPEVPSWAFGPLLGEPSDFPEHPSTLDYDRLGSIYRAMGITRGPYLGTCDYLYDRRLRIVAEWRNPANLAKTRRRDEVVRAVIRWVGDLGYQLRILGRERWIVRVGLPLRRMPVLGRVMAKKVSPHTAPQLLMGGLALSRLGRALDDRLVAEIGEAHLPPETLAEHLDRIREADREVWERAPRRSAFHRLLSPA